MRPDTRPRAKKIPLTQEQRDHLAHSARRRELLREARRADERAQNNELLRRARDRTLSEIHLLSDVEARFIRDELERAPPIVPGPAPSAAAIAERDRNDAALHLLDELETAVRAEAAATKAGDEAGAGAASKTAALVIEAGATLGYVLSATRGRLGCVREIAFAEGPVDEAAAASVAAAAHERRAAHAKAVRKARQAALRAASSSPRPQFVEARQAVDGSTARP